MDLQQQEFDISGAKKIKLQTPCLKKTESMIPFIIELFRMLRRGFSGRLKHPSEDKEKFLMKKPEDM